MVWMGNYVIYFHMDVIICSSPDPQIRADSGTSCNIKGSIVYYGPTL